MPSFVELHARSAFSFHRGASSPESLARRAAALDMPGLALCDRDGVYGAPRLHAAAREEGVRAWVGSEVTLDDESVVPLLAASRRGYQNLCRMLTRVKLRAPKNQGRARWAELAEFSEGLICLTGDEEGPVWRAVARRDRAAAEAAVRRLKDAFGAGNVYVEIQRRRRREDARIEAGLCELAERFGLSVVASNGVVYEAPEGRELYDVFTCLRHHTHLDAAGALLSANAERHLKPATAMARLFKDRPEAAANTARAAERLEFTLENLGYQFPDFPVAAGETMEARLREETYRGAKARYGRLTPPVKRQLERELALINKLGFAGYFLIVWDLCRFAKEKDILIQGRGSAANSAVCYSLGVTVVDPIGQNLLFERFLSEGRTSWPDIDLDLPSGDQREAMIQEVYRRFGPRGAAMTANVISYRGRSAVREIGKALNLPQEALERFSGMYHSGDFPQTIEFQKQMEQSGLPAAHPRFPALARLYQQAYGLPRHLGQHCGGMVISNHGLDAVVPLENAAMPGRVALQWDKDDCEDLGIIKIDFLGLGMLAAIEDCLALCAGRGPKRAVAFDRIPNDDKATYEMIQKADTIGVFQIESRAQMATLPRMKPKTFYDLVVEVAIIRPGPIAGNLTHPYLDRRAGRADVTYMHPDLKPTLERTLGVPLFQEQMLKIAMVMADFTGSEAEELRRALSFHRSQERMDKVVVKLKAALDERGVAEDVQRQIVDSIRSFALYGFPESHAISFARLAYNSAWLRCHRAVEFYVSLLNNQPMGFYSPDTLIKDAKRRGIRARPVNVARSDWRCAVESDDAFRLGLMSVKGLSHGAADRILSARRERPWRDLEDFLTRARLNKDERRVLAEIGALNGLAAHRRDALWEVEKEADPQGLFSRRQDRESGEEPRDEVLAPMTPEERLEADYRGMHLSTGPHPMSYVRDRLPQIWRAVDLPLAKPGQRVAIAGLVICRQRPGTAKGNMFISLEDETGIANAFVPSKVFEENRLIITQEKFLLIEGNAQNADNVITILGRRFASLDGGSLDGRLSHDFH